MPIIYGQHPQRPVLITEPSLATRIVEQRNRVQAAAEKLAKELAKLDALEPQADIDPSNPDPVTHIARVYGDGRITIANSSKERSTLLHEVRARRLAFTPDKRWTWYED